MNESILSQFRMTVMERKLNVYGIIVYSKNAGTVTHRWRSDDAECLYSGSKTFTSLAIGICEDEGRLKLTDKVIDFFPEYRSVCAEDTHQTTVRDLLHMASGQEIFRLHEVKEPEIWLNTDWAELFFKEPLKHKPGTYFYYSNPCSYMLSRIVEKVSGTTLRDFLAPRLFRPLGILNPQWHTCPGGHTDGATGLYMKTEEYARLGKLLLNGGEWYGKRIVSKEYLDKAVGDLIDNNRNPKFDSEKKAGYGYQIWRCTIPDVYRADGMYGQFSIVIPDREAVVTVTSHEEKAPNDIIRAVFHDILPNL